ncbi:MAG TPA: UDP-2,3-diacylglucosamine diphosphatase [Isosphaeraceae bacterium]
MDDPTTLPPPADPPYDCLVISDLHLGSLVCQAKLLEEFLEWAAASTRELIINGDIFDDLNFKRLSKRHFGCLRSIRRHSDRPGLKLIWIRGNHDGPADIVSHIVGVEILEEYIVDTGPVRLLILHGDQFDHFITKYKYITSAAVGLFYYIQRLAPHNAARWIRRVSKRWQRNSQVVMRGAVEFARTRGCNAVTCGHTHLPLVAEVDGVRYINSGTWTEQPPCPFVSLRGGELRLEWWPIRDVEAPAENEAHAEDPEPSDVEWSVLPTAR